MALNLVLSPCKSIKKRNGLFVLIGLIFGFYVYSISKLEAEPSNDQPNISPLYPSTEKIKTETDILLSTKQSKYGITEEIPGKTPTAATKPDWIPPLAYKWQKITGKTFSNASKYLDDVLYPIPRMVPLSRDVMRNFSYVTAVSENHFLELRKAVYTLRKNCCPHQEIIIYDIGLSQNSSTEVRSWRNVKYVKFDFSRYPPHVKRLRYYAFKPLILLEALRLNAALFWIDASVRMQEVNITKLYDHVFKRSGIALLKVIGGLKNTIVTHPGMYEYLPTNQSKQSEIDLFTATMFVVNTEYNFKHVIYWHALCALEKMCIAPTDQLRCDFKNPDAKQCHRYDQAAINLLLCNDKRFKMSSYGISDVSTFLTIERGDTKLPYSWQTYLQGEC